MNILSTAALQRGIEEIRCADRRSLREKVKAHQAAVARALANQAAHS